MQAAPAPVKKDDDGETRPLLAQGSASLYAEDLGTAERGAVDLRLPATMRAAQLAPVVLCLGLIPGTASSFYLSSVGFFTDKFGDHSLFSEQLFLVFGSAVPIFALKLVDDHLDFMFGTWRTISCRLLFSSVLLTFATMATAFAETRSQVYAIGLLTGVFSFVMISAAAEIASFDGAACGTWMHTGVAIGAVLPKTAAQIFAYGPKADLLTRIAYFGLPAAFCGVLSAFLCGIIVVAMREITRIKASGCHPRSAARAQSLGTALAAVYHRMQPATGSLSGSLAGGGPPASAAASSSGSVVVAPAAAPPPPDPAAALQGGSGSDDQQVSWLQREPFLEFQALSHAFTGMVASFLLLSYVPDLGSAKLAQRLYMSKVCGDFLGRIWVSIFWGSEAASSSSLRIPVQGHLILAGVANKVRVSLCLFLVLPLFSPEIRDHLHISDNSKQLLFIFIFTVGATIGSWLEAVFSVAMPPERRRFTSRCQTFAHFGGLLVGLIVAEVVRMGGHVRPVDPVQDSIL